MLGTLAFPVLLAKHSHHNKLEERYFIMGALAQQVSIILPFVIGLLVGGLGVWLWTRISTETSREELRLSFVSETALIDQLRHHTNENNRLAGSEGEEALFDFITSEALLAGRIDEIAEAIDSSDSYDEAFAKARVIPFRPREAPGEDNSDLQPPEDDPSRWERIKGKAKGVKDKALKVANQKLQSTVKSWAGDASQDE
ncbi:hypothetical protein [Salipiger abyssi]|uniref:hypothetical protein n=1 Tax=Salipiger abyssi TaxID=1250539 RepID=UPI001A8CA097|nr:hypothetical protein [Salipiger abyssi]MBN9887794.1 hypothetical protein [Salipiger abyssi]